MATDENRVTTIADEIARYMARRPHAADTVDGIRQWWLAGSELDATAVEIEQALDLLGRRGAVVESTLPDGNVVYRSAQL